MPVSACKKKAIRYYRIALINERETGIEPATSTLARWRSTTELFPQMYRSVCAGVELCERRDLNPHAKAPDPKSGVSANSTTLAHFVNESDYTDAQTQCQASKKHLYYLSFPDTFEPCRLRTCDPQIKSLLLYQLS